MKTSFLSLIVFTLSLLSCQKNMVTGRKQLLLLNEKEVQAMALTEYRSFLKQNPAVAAGTTRDQIMVAQVGMKISKAVQQYLEKQGQSDLITGYQWEFNLVNKPDINAWCMPGGKVVVYSGLLSVTKNESALAVVMGHEVAHAIAKHGNERMSQGLLQQMGGITLSAAIANKPAETRALFMGGYGVVSTVGGILPFSRKHELEADRFGLIFAAMAGYDPREAEAFWVRMSNASGAGNKPPEFFSTHPSDETRVAKVREYAQEAMKYYKP
jgi:predicted Zn-dependent protease